MQFAASVSRRRHDQRQIGNLDRNRLNPQALQQPVDKFGSGFNKLFEAQMPPSPSQPVLKDVDAGFDTGDGQFEGRGPEPWFCGWSGVGGGVRYSRCVQEEYSYAPPIKSAG
ncbi:hypothetical protein KCP71_00485 [Salmonella enterica subsp. enterica]|nr:hypothetical protein KCP71_00485 [Salmonella enterica subsp. enterica]